jgi:hypothetical protein
MRCGEVVGSGDRNHSNTQATCHLERQVSRFLCLSPQSPDLHNDLNPDPSAVSVERIRVLPGPATVATRSGLVGSNG